jgi:hypothetical protein
MSTCWTYRTKAKICLEEAEKIHDLTERVTMLGIAHDYWKLADHVSARLDRGEACQLSTDAGVHKDC